MLAPLLKHMRDSGVDIPDGFNVRSRCVPSWETVKEGLEEQIRQAEEKVRTQGGLGEPGKGERRLGDRLEWWRIEKTKTHIMKF